MVVSLIQDFSISCIPTPLVIAVSFDVGTVGLDSSQLWLRAPQNYSNHITILTDNKNKYFLKK